jgi:alcohol dehydrogenase class IV
MSNTGAFQLNLRTLIQSGPGTSVRLPNLFHGLGAKRVALISDEGLANAGLIDRIANLFTTNAQPGAPKIVCISTETKADADSDSVNLVLQKVRAAGADSILALGGGSVLDSAKMVKMAMFKKVDTIDDLLKSELSLMNWPDAQHMGVPHIAVPTTSGTGSEITTGAVILNAKKGRKSVIISDFLDPDIALLDGHLTTSLPPMLTAATGLDALTHAVEILTHMDCNKFTLAYIMMATKEILEWLPKAVANGQDVEARQAVAIASCMAGYGPCSHVAACPVHNMAHAFGGMYHIHHGEANGVFMPLLMQEHTEFYMPAAERFKEAFAVEGTDPREIILNAAAKLQDMMQAMGHPIDFKRHNIPESALPDLIVAVQKDPIAALGQIPVDVIERIARRACAW